jgi:cytochrome c553
MTRKILGVVAALAAVLMLLAAQPGGAFAAPAKKNACLSCHTNGAMMKALYKPPVLDSGEAEG